MVTGLAPTLQPLALTAVSTGTGQTIPRRQHQTTTWVGVLRSLTAPALMDLPLDTLQRGLGWLHLGLDLQLEAAQLEAAQLRLQLSARLRLLTWWLARPACGTGMTSAATPTSSYRCLRSHVSENTLAEHASAWGLGTTASVHLDYKYLSTWPAGAANGCGSCSTMH